MINKEFIFSKIKELEDAPKGVILFKNNNIYLDLLNLTWQCKETLCGYGVSDSLANKFVNYYGQIGDEAKKAVKKSVLLAADDVQTLFKVSVRVSTREVSEHVGKEIFKELPDPVQVVLVSLWRQFGRLGRFDLPALTMTTKMLIRGHIQAAMRYLGNEKGWGLENSMPRRLKEAVFLGTFIGEGK